VSEHLESISKIAGDVAQKLNGVWSRVK